jgi:hypothetical protein
LIAFRHSSGQGAVSVVDASGERVRPVLTAEATETFGKLEWSPDGQRVGVIVRRVGDPNISIDAVEVATRKRAELVRQPNLRTFVWLPDGRLLFVTQGRESGDSAILHELDARGRERRLDIGSDVAPADISASIDGKRIVLVRAKVQSDVYTAEMKGKERITDLVRATLDDRDDRPTGWLSDSRTFLFESNRNGTLDIFRQSVQSPAAELLVGGPETQFGAQAAPDGKTVLYWSRRDDQGRMQLMAVPAGGGPATPLFDVQAPAQFHCAAARTAEPVCALANVENGKMRVSEFSPRGGPLRLIREMEFAGDAGAPWALGSNPTRLALLAGGRLRVIEVMSGASWDLNLADLPGKVTGLSFAGQGGDLLLSVGSARGNSLLLVSRSGVRQLCEFPRALSYPILSPDGKRLLVQVDSATSNAWLLENF